jgi:hypothetical protein
MIKFSFSQSDIDEVYYWRFQHPDPMVMKRCDTVFLKSTGLKTGQIHELTGRNAQTIRAHLHLYKEGGIDGLLDRQPYRPQSKLETYRHTRSFKSFAFVLPYCRGRQ